jgi:hypothetical protein
MALRASGGGDDEGDNTDPAWIIEEGVPGESLGSVPFRNVKSGPASVAARGMDHVACGLHDNFAASIWAVGPQPSRACRAMMAATREDKQTEET